MNQVTRVRLTRYVAFSSGHRYWFSHLSREENQALFGNLASPFSHGHNYVLQVECSGFISPDHGMVVNIKTIDDIIKSSISHQFDMKSINDEIPYFADHAPTTENILSYIKDILIQVLPSEVRLEKLILNETPTLYAELVLQKNIMQLTRTYEFAAAHRLNAPGLDEAENVQLFGKCNHINGHGHNYVLEVTVQGMPDSKTGMITDVGAIDAIVSKLVLDRYDHRNLNLDVEELVGKNTTSEVVALEIFKQLNGKLPTELSRIRLYETARNMFEVCQADVIL